MLNLSFNKFIRWTAAFTLAVYLPTNLDLAYAAPSILSRESAIPAAAAQFQQSLGLGLPAQLGRIESLHPGTKGTILHIQTAHGHYEAQLKTEKLLQWLRQKYGSFPILLEGATGKLDSHRLDFLKDQSDFNLKNAHRLARQALVSGPELYLMQHQNENAYGIETALSYRKNRKQFVGVHKARNEARNFSALFDRAMEQAAAVFSPELRAFLKRLEQHELGIVSFEAWLTELQKAAVKSLKLDLNDAAWQVSWPMLVRFFKIHSLAKEFDAAKYEVERTLFLKALRAAKAIPDTTSGVNHRHLGGGSVAGVEQLLNSFGQSVQLPEPQTENTFIEMLQRLPRDFDFKTYPQVTRFIGLLILQSQLKPLEMTEEISRLETLISEKLTRNETEKNLLGVFADYRLLEKLLALQLTPADYEAISDQRSALRVKPSEILKRLNAERSTQKASTSPALVVERKAMSELDLVFETAIQFYQGARERDQVMVQRAEELLKQHSSKLVVIETGGFHTDAMREHFEKAGYAYGVVTPAITGLDEAGYQAYLKAMMRSSVARDQRSAVSVSNQMLTLARSMDALGQMEGVRGEVVANTIRAIRAERVLLTQVREIKGGFERNRTAELKNKRSALVVPPKAAKRRETRREMQSAGGQDSELGLARAELRSLEPVVKRAAEFLLRDTRHFYNELRNYLTTGEMTFDEFVAKAEEMLRSPPSGAFQKLRTMFGFSGAFASGKTTYAEAFAEIIAQKYPKTKVLKLFFDDFLLQKSDRPPLAADDHPNQKEDPYFKYVMQRYKEFVHLLKENKLAAKPIYDQTSKGQLKFGLDEKGRIALFSGNRTISIRVHPDDTFDIQEIFMDERGSKTDLLLGRKDESETKIPQNKIVEYPRFKSGETPMSFRMDKKVLVITVRDQEYRIEQKGDEAILVTAGWNDAVSIKNKKEQSFQPKPVRLTREKQEEALEIWKPASTDGAAEIVVGEGILLLDAEGWDMTASVNANFTIRRFRALLRALLRGQGKKEIRHLEQALDVRGVMEDSHVMRLDAEKRQGRGHENHFQVSSRSLSEIMLTSLYYGAFSKRNGSFRHTDEGRAWDKLDFNYGEIADAYELRFMKQLMKIVRKLAGTKTLISGPFFGREFEGLFLGQKFIRAHKARSPLQIIFDQQSANGFEDKDWKNLGMILERSQGVVLPAQLIDLELDPWLEIFISGEKQKVGRFLVTEILPLIREKLKRTLREAEDSDFVTGFFETQREMLDLGIVDLHPDMMGHYGLGLFHGTAKVLSVNPFSLEVINDDESGYSRIIADQKRKENQFLKIVSSYPGHQDRLRALSLYQRQFIFDAQTEKNYLEQIPENYRQQYLEELLKFIPASLENQDAVKVGYVWKKAAYDQRTGRLRNLPVETLTTDISGIRFLQEVFSVEFAGQLTRRFFHLFRTSKTNEFSGAAPGRILIQAYADSLSEEVQPALYHLFQEINAQIQKDPALLKGWADKPKITVEKLIRDLRKKFSEEKKKFPRVEAWEANLAANLISVAGQFPRSWAAFDKLTPAKTERVVEAFEKQIWANLKMFRKGAGRSETRGPLLTKSEISQSLESFRKKYAAWLKVDVQVVSVYEEDPAHPHQFRNFRILLNRIGPPQAGQDPQAVILELVGVFKKVGYDLDHLPGWKKSLPRNFAEHNHVILNFSHHTWLDSPWVAWPLVSAVMVAAFAFLWLFWGSPFYHSIVDPKPVQTVYVINQPMDMSQWPVIAEIKNRGFTSSNSPLIKITEGEAKHALQFSHLDGAEFAGESWEISAQAIPRDTKFVTLQFQVQTKTGKPENFKGEVQFKDARTGEWTRSPVSFSTGQNVMTISIPAQIPDLTPRGDFFEVTLIFYQPPKEFTVIASPPLFTTELPSLGAKRPRAETRRRSPSWYEDLRHGGAGERFMYGLITPDSQNDAARAEMLHSLSDEMTAKLTPYEWKVMRMLEVKVHETRTSEDYRMIRVAQNGNQGFVGLSVLRDLFEKAYPNLNWRKFNGFEKSAQTLRIPAIVTAILLPSLGSMAHFVFGMTFVAIVGSLWFWGAFAVFLFAVVILVSNHVLHVIQYQNLKRQVELARKAEPDFERIADIVFSNAKIKLKINEKYLADQPPVWENGGWYISVHEYVQDGEAAEGKATKHQIKRIPHAKSNLWGVVRNGVLYFGELPVDARGNSRPAIERLPQSSRVSSLVGPGAFFLLPAAPRSESAGEVVQVSRGGALASWVLLIAFLGLASLGAIFFNWKFKQMKAHPPEEIRRPANVDKNVAAKKTGNRSEMRIAVEVMPYLGLAGIALIVAGFAGLVLFYQEMSRRSQKKKFIRKVGLDFIHKSNAMAALKAGISGDVAASFSEEKVMSADIHLPPADEEWLQFVRKEMGKEVPFGKFHQTLGQSLTAPDREIRYPLFAEQLVFFIRELFRLKKLSREKDSGLPVEEVRRIQELKKSLDDIVLYDQKEFMHAPSDYTIRRWRHRVERLISDQYVFARILIDVLSSNGIIVPVELAGALVGMDAQDAWHPLVNYFAHIWNHLDYVEKRIRGHEIRGEYLRHGTLAEVLEQNSAGNGTALESIRSVEIIFKLGPPLILNVDKMGISSWEDFNAAFLKNRGTEAYDPNSIYFILVSPRSEARAQGWHFGYEPVAQKFDKSKDYERDLEVLREVSSKLHPGGVFSSQDVTLNGSAFFDRANWMSRMQMYRLVERQELPGQLPKARRINYEYRLTALGREYIARFKMRKSEALEQLRAHPWIVGGLHDSSPETIADDAGTLIEEGILPELPTPETVRKVRAENPNALIFATIKTDADLFDMASAGANILVSNTILSAEIIYGVRERFPEVILIMGAVTRPEEVDAAIANGADGIKIKPTVIPGGDTDNARNLIRYIRVNLNNQDLLIMGAGGIKAPNLKQVMTALAGMNIFASGIDHPAQDAAALSHFVVRSEMRTSTDDEIIAEIMQAQKELGAVRARIESLKAIPPGKERDGVIDSERVNENRLLQSIADLTGRLQQSLSGAVQLPLEKVRLEESLLAAHLVHNVSEREISEENFYRHHVLPAIQALQAGKRLKIGYSGTGAGGKTTAAHAAEDRLKTALAGQNTSLRRLTFDDFLRPKKERQPQSTQDPKRKFDVETYVKFMQHVDAGELAVKPMYDQGSKGRLEFALDAKGNPVLFNGDREIAFQLNPDGTFDFNETLHEEKGDRNLSQERFAEHGIPHRRVKKAVAFDSAETHVEAERLGDGRLKVILRGSAVFYIRRDGKKIFFETEGYRPDGQKEIELSKEKMNWALDVWLPLRPDEKQVVIGEGILILAYPNWDLTANVNVSFVLRIIRAMLRQVQRGRPANEIKREIENRIILQAQEDLVIDELNRKAKEDPNRRDKHFQINNRSLAELILRNSIYNLIPGGASQLNEQFLEKGLNAVSVLLDGVAKRGEEALIEWIQKIRNEHSLDNPFAWPHTENESLDAAFDRYFHGSFKTFLMINDILVKFMIQPERMASTSRPGRVGEIDGHMQRRLGALFERSHELFVPAQMVNLKGNVAGQDFPIKELTKPPKKGRAKEHKRPIDLHTVLLTNSIPFAHGRLQEIDKKYREMNSFADLMDQAQTAAVAKKREQAEEVLAKGKQIIDRFFDLQDRMYQRGIIDVYPHLPSRYGFGIIHGEEQLLSTGPSSLFVDDDGGLLENIEVFARRQDKKPLSKDAYPNIPGYRQLKGYQRQFVRNDKDGKDLLATIPESLRAYYVERVLRRTPRYAAEFKDGKNFGAVWEKAKRDGTQRQFRNMGVSSPLVDAEKLGFIQNYLAQKFYLQELSRQFDVYFENLADRPGTPQLAWSALFMGSLTPDSNDALFSLAQALHQRLLSQPDWLEKEKASASGLTIDRAYQAVEEILRAERAKGGRFPLIRKWQKEAFKGFLDQALKLPPDWKNFKPGIADARAELRSEIREVKVSPIGQTGQGVRVSVAEAQFVLKSKQQGYGFATWLKGQEIAAKFDGSILQIGEERIALEQIETSKPERVRLQKALHSVANPEELIQPGLGEAVFAARKSFAEAVKGLSLDKNRSFVVGLMTALKRHVDETKYSALKQSAALLVKHAGVGADKDEDFLGVLKGVAQTYLSNGKESISSPLAIIFSLAVEQGLADSTTGQIRSEMRAQWISPVELAYSKGKVVSLSQAEEFGRLQKILALLHDQLPLLDHVEDGARVQLGGVFSNGKDLFIPLQRDSHDPDTAVQLTRATESSIEILQPIKLIAELDAKGKVLKVEIRIAEVFKDTFRWEMNDSGGVVERLSSQMQKKTGYEQLERMVQVLHRLEKATGISDLNDPYWEDALYSNEGTLKERLDGYAGHYSMSRVTARRHAYVYLLHAYKFILDKIIELKKLPADKNAIVARLREWVIVRDYKSFGPLKGESIDLNGFEAQLRELEKAMALPTFQFKVQYAIADADVPKLTVWEIPVSWQDEPDKKQIRQLFKYIAIQDRALWRWFKILSNEAGSIAFSVRPAPDSTIQNIKMQLTGFWMPESRALYETAALVRDGISMEQLNQRISALGLIITMKPTQFRGEYDVLITKRSESRNVPALQSPIVRSELKSVERPAFSVQKISYDGAIRQLTEWVGGIVSRAWIAGLTSIQAAQKMSAMIGRNVYAEAWNVAPVSRLKTNASEARWTLSGRAKLGGQVMLHSKVVEMLMQNGRALFVTLQQFKTSQVSEIAPLVFFTTQAGLEGKMIEKMRGYDSGLSAEEKRQIPELMRYVQIQFVENESSMARAMNAYFSEYRNSWGITSLLPDAGLFDQLREVLTLALSESAVADEDAVAIAKVIRALAESATVSGGKQIQYLQENLPKLTKRGSGWVVSLIDVIDALIAAHELTAISA